MVPVSNPLLLAMGSFPLIVCHSELSEVAIHKIILFGRQHEFLNLALKHPNFIFIFEKLLGDFDVLAVAQDILVNIDTGLLEEPSKINFFLLAGAFFNLLDFTLRSWDKIIINFRNLFWVLNHIFEDL